MSDLLYLAWRYLAFHRVKTAVLIGSITMIIYLPAGLSLLVNHGAEQLTERAAATPLLVGAKGSPLELVLSSLYFESDVPPTLRYAEVNRILQSDLGTAIPLDTRFRTQHSPIVGTSLDYFDFRQLAFHTGRPFGMLGECVLGYQAARLAGIGPGGAVMSQPENVFDIAGVYPLKLHVVGVLEPTGTPDDRAVFVDVKTAWVIEGLAHGHADLARPAQQQNVLQQQGTNIIANAAVMQFNEITPENVGSFHFHGDPKSFPITAIIAVPHDEKSGVLLQGRYLGDEQLVQIVRPEHVMRELLHTVMAIKRYVLLAGALLSGATLATMALVFTLSLQLRRRELETMVKIGGARWRIGSLVVVEMLSVLIAGVIVAGGLCLATQWFVSSAARAIVQWS